MNACEGAFRLGPDRHRDPGRDEVEDDDRRAVIGRDGVGEAQGELGVGAAADRDEDALDLARPALLHDGDVARRVADDLVDRRREDRRAVPASRPAGVLPPQPKMMRSASCSADASMMPSAAWRPMRTIGWIVVPVRRVVEHLLEQSPGVPGAGRALGQRHALGDLDDAQRRQRARPRIEHGGPEPDQLLGRARVGDRDEDPCRERRARAHRDGATASLGGVPLVHEIRLEQLELARLTLDAILGLVRRLVPVLDDEASRRARSRSARAPRPASRARASGPGRR